MGRLAAIDVGSNSIHMIAVEPEAGGGYGVLGRERVREVADLVTRSSQRRHGAAARAQ